MLVHVVDVAGSEGRDPIDDFNIINAELEKFDPELAELPQIVAANKVDLAEDEQLERFRAFIKEKDLPYYEIIAPICEGTGELINAVAAKLAELPPVKHYDAQPVPMELLEKKKDNGFRIIQDGDDYYVEAEWLLKILNKTDTDDYESLQYFQRVLESSGILEELRSRGIREGDTVIIYDLEFQYVP